jgi:hypothetical protein
VKKACSRVQFPETGRKFPRAASKGVKRQGESRIVEERRANKTGLRFCRPVLLKVRPARPTAHISVYMIFSDS